MIAEPHGTYRRTLRLVADRAPALVVMADVADLRAEGAHAYVRKDETHVQLVPVLERLARS